MKFDISLRYALGSVAFEFDENRIDDDVIVTSFKFSPNYCTHLKFYSTHERRT